MPNEITALRPSLAPSTFGEAIEFSKMLAKSDMVPAAYRNKPENILLAMQWGMEVGLGPLQAIQNIAVINGKPSVYGDALLALVRGASVCDDVIESFDGEGDSLTAVCIAKRRGKVPVPARFSVADAKKAGLWNKQGPWQQYPRRMLQMRARGFALRDAFPDLLRGIITREEAEDYPREPIDVTPRDARAGLDAFATAKLAEPFDADTGEVLDAAAIERDARSAASCGTGAFREHLRCITREARAILNGKVGTKDEPGELLTLALNTDEALRSAPPDEPADAFGLPINSPPGTSETLHPTEQPDAAAPNTRQPGGDTIPDMLGGEARPAVSHRFNLPRDMTGFKWQAFVDHIDAKLDDGVPGRVLRSECEYALKALKSADPDLYDRIQGRLSGG